jgi:hypothetical protein
MKKAAILAAGLALAVAAVVPAFSAPGASHGTVLSASTSPSRKGKPTKPVGVKIHTVFTTQPPAQGQPGFATKRTVVHLPKYLRFHGDKFKHCSEATLNASGPTACPSGSKIGSGTAQGQALGQTENLTVLAFNGQGSKQLLLYVQGSTPLAINSTIVGTLKNDTGKYGKKLDVAIPANLQQPLTNVYATLTKFDTTIGGKVGGKNYVDSIGCIKSKRNWGADLEFTDGTSDKTTTTSTCT